MTEYASRNSRGDGRVFGIDINAAQDLIRAADEFGDHTGIRILPYSAPRTFEQVVPYAPLAEAVVGELGGGEAITPEVAAAYLPMRMMRRRTPNMLRPLLATESDLPGLAAWQVLHTLLYDSKTTGDWAAGQLDTAEPFVQGLNVEHPNEQLLADIVTLMNGVQHIAREEAAKEHKRAIDPEKPDEGVEPGHIATGLSKMLGYLIDNDPWMIQNMPLITSLTNAFLEPRPRLKRTAKQKLNSHWKLTMGAHSVIGALNDALPEEYRNLRLEEDAWRPNRLARVAKGGLLKAIRKDGAAVLRAAQRTLPESGQDLQEPFGTLRQHFPSRRLIQGQDQVLEVAH